MGRGNALSALSLEMPGKIPRTEYSAHTHWKLVSAVTGKRVSENSTQTERETASREFTTLWDYGIMWNIYLMHQRYNGRYTKMGHAAYAQGGVDFSDEIQSLFDDPEDVYSFDVEKEFGYGDIASMKTSFDENYDEQARLYPDLVAMTGIYTTCMSGLIELLGWDTLLEAAGLDPKAFGEFTDRYCHWMTPCFEKLAESKSQVVMIHDDIVWTDGAFLHPDFYRKYIFPNYKKMFSPLIEAKKTILYTSDGNYTQFIDDIADSGVSGFVLEPCTDMKYMCEKYGKTHIIVGNADTRILLSGTKDDIENEVKRCISLGKDCPGYFMAVGNHIPANTPVENALWYNEMYEKYSRR